MRGLRLAGVVAAALVLVPVAGRASDQDDALRLARRVASTSGDATLVLHAPPSNLPAWIPLPNASLLGSVGTTPGAPEPGAPGYGRMLTLYYDTRDRAAAVTAYERALRSAGWTAVDQGHQYPLPGGGFSVGFPGSVTWCSPRDPLTAIHFGLATNDAGALDVSIALGGVFASMQCGRETPGSRTSVSAITFNLPFSKIPLPSFVATSGVAIENSGPAMDGSTTGARITSSLGLAAVFESFAKQLRDAGWTPKTSASSAGGLQAQTFTKTVEGKACVALLAVHALDATHYAALADVSNIQQ